MGWGGVPSRAVDGGISGWYPHGTCACSAHAGKNDWSVNLIDSYKVDSVVIFNRRDCCQERLIGAKVLYIFLDFGLVYLIPFLKLGTQF